MSIGFKGLSKGEDILEIWMKKLFLKCYSFDLEENWEKRI